LGQFTSYWPGGCAPSEYVYYQSDSLYAIEGEGGLGFLMLDAENNIKYASNSKNLCIPSSIGQDFTIYSYDADGSLHEVPLAGSGTVYVTLTSAGTLKSKLENNQAIRLIVSGPINTTDLTYMKQLVSKENLQAIDLEKTTRITSIAASAFSGIKKLVAINLPTTLTSIGSNAFSNSGLRSVTIPDKVTSVGGDAFAYCGNLTSVVVGEKVRSMDQGVFYSSAVKEAYFKPLTPPTLNGVSDYLFSGKNRTIHVYSNALSKYKAAGWDRFGTLVGDLENCEVVTPVVAPMAEKKTIMENAPIYNLQGMRVVELQPGTIYIQHGKKFMK
jgi:hypothetical protein